MIQVWLATLLGLWAVDVVAHLGLLEGLMAGPTLPARARDFLGLLLADLLPALVVVAVGLAAAVTSDRWLRGRGLEREVVVCVSAVSAALVVLAGLRLTWGLHAAQPATMILTAVAGGSSWLALRALDRGGRQKRAWTLTYLMSRIVPPSLLSALAIRAVSLAVRGDWKRAGVDGIVVLACVGLVRASRAESRSWSLARMGWAVPALALFLALRVVAVSAWPGRGPEHDRTAASAGRPHIVLIVLDTVRADHLQRYGYGRNTMPALERWGDSATVVRRALSAAGWTSPSHASIFSGLPVSLHGVHFASGRSPALSTPPIEGIAWLPQGLADLGYFRLAVSANPRAIPDVGGFSRVIAPERYSWQLSTLGSLFDRQLLVLERLNSRTRWQTPYIDAEEVVDLVEAATPDGDGPIFLFVNFLDAHSPYNPPREALRRLGLEPGGAIHRYALHRELTKSWDRLPGSKEEDLLDLYDGELNGLDQQLGRLLEWIDRRLGGETTVIVTSDHGEELGEEGRVGHEFGLDQRLIHVPLLIRSPHLPGGEFDEIVDIRRLHDFVLATATGEANEGVLVRDDGYGHLSERYPTEHNVRSIGPGYDRPWVSLVEGGVKAVGPSSQGLELLALDAQNFSHELVVPADTVGVALGQRIDEYWERLRDRREETTESAAPSEEEMKVLRSLGYVP